MFRGASGDEFYKMGEEWIVRACYSVVAWVALPFTDAAPLIAMNKVTGQVFLGNLLLWPGLVDYLFISWSNAYVCGNSARAYLSAA